MSFNLKKRPILSGKTSTISAFIKYHGEVEEYFEGVEKKFREFDAQKWFDENVYENWTWEGMLQKFIEKEILGE